MKTLAPFLIAVTCAGCFHVGHMEGGRHTISSINQLGRQQTLYVHHFGDRRAAAENLRITPTHTSWVDASTGQYITIPTEEIVDIKVREHFARKGNGFGVGMLAGASMGVMVGLSGNANASEKSTYAVLGGMGFGLFGGMIAQMTNRGDAVKYRVIWTNPAVPIRRAVW